MEFSIRRFKEEDLENLYLLLSDKDVMEFIEEPYTYEKCEKFLIKVGLCESPLIYVVEDESKMFIGYVIFHEYDSKSFEIGFSKTFNKL